MSYKQIPITAKILKTTKGGVTQPILNMGAPVQMKAPSPTQKRSRSGYKTPTPSAPRAKASNPRIKNSRQDLAAKRKELTTEVKPTTKSKATIDGEAGRDADDLARKNNTGKYTKITGKIGSDLRRKQYKEKGYANDDTTMKSKAKVANTIKAKKGVDAKKDRTTTLETKLDPKNLKTQAAKVNSKKEVSAGAVRESNRKNASADRKESRAARVAQKAKEAKDSGNTDKADRLKRREARITKRANKKRGQAASAIQPK